MYFPAERDTPHRISTRLNPEAIQINQNNIFLLDLALDKLLDML
jgi:hypothetical protein